jgi:hypothetical protein
MTKMIKMSLVAAVAVAGLSTSATAGQNMAEWAKNTTLSGYVRYRLVNDMETTGKGDTTEEAKAVMKFTTPVNDAVTANLKYKSEALTKKAEVVADTAVIEGNFVVKAGGATVIAGLQTSQSPFFANNGDTRSHGVTALIPAGGLTVAAAYYTTSVGGDMVNSGGSVLANNVMALAAIGKAGNVDFQGWYATVQDTADVEDVKLSGVKALGLVDLKDASAMNLTVGADLGAVKIDAMTTQISANDLDFGMTKVVASGKAGEISWAAAYAMTNEDGGMVALDRDSDAVSDLAMHTLNMGATSDASAFYVMGKLPVADKTTVQVDYLSGSSDAHPDFDELDVTVNYAMSKNFYAYLRYFQGDNVGTDFKGTRIEVKYSF